MSLAIEEEKRRLLDQEDYEFQEALRLSRLAYEQYLEYLRLYQQLVIFISFIVI